MWFVDLWDLVPPEHFTDTILHMDRVGNGLFAARITRILADAAAAYSSP
jgi:hypothetical protein